MPWGAEALRARQDGGQADPRLDRLLGLPLVPRDGARVVRGSADGRGDERALRVHQGRPRGAARRRRHLHGGLPGDDRPGRLAAQRLPHAGPGAVLRGHLLPARTALRHAQLAAGAGRDRRTRGASGATRSEQASAPDRATACAAARCCGPSEDELDPGLLDEAVANAARAPTTATQRRLRRSAQVPALVGCSSSCCGAARRRWSLQHAARDGGRRHVRPDRRRLRPLLRGRPLARSRTSRRCSTTTRCSRAPTCTAGR